jgi:predicted acyltransferase (DUF342 family)
LKAARRSQKNPAQPANGCAGFLSLRAQKHIAISNGSFITGVLETKEQDEGRLLN